MASVDIVGGNITSARQMAITIALLGDCPPHPLRRDLARVGDEIFVTGTVGDAALGWRLLDGRIRASGHVRHHLVTRYLSPVARLDAGQRLARFKPRIAAIDVSDGLLQDLGHVIERSDVSAQIDAESIPVSKAYNRVMGKDLSLALSGGEDYELLFCLGRGHSEHELSRLLRLPIHRIGRVVRGSGVRIEGGDAASLVAGWDQMRAR
jgi:thiamine-monophosphate kinase